MGTERAFTPRERDVVVRLLEGATFPGSAELRAQVPATKVIGGISTYFDLVVDGSVPRANSPDGPIPGRAFVEGETGEPEGELLLWVKEGHLSGLEFAWVADEPPKEMPPPERVRIVGLHSEDESP